ncbi:hypothetical protein AAFC00_004883 [Neodothiora populina]|uniref:WW domain-binding protein n=1 Tax=Neodothiora populina TaxID=2781224 RepID=A0ABR3P4B4_9PEZI
MSINWVMLTTTHPPRFTPLPNESTLYTSPPRTTLSLASIAKFPSQQPFSLSCSQGTLYLTNRRLIYLPATPSKDFQSFAAPILNTHDSHVVAPWIGPNVWTALIQPVQGGGIPIPSSSQSASAAAIECKITFKEGGAYDFHGRYERVKERLRQAVEVARESGHFGGGQSGDGSEIGRGRGGGSLAGVDVAGVHLDDLPRYEEAAAPAAPGVSVLPPQGLAVAPQQEVQTQPPPTKSSQDSAGAETSAQTRTTATTTATQDRQSTSFNPLAEPPPGYEEVQRETVQDELERRMNGRT